MSDVLTIAAFQQNIIWEDPSANRLAIAEVKVPFPTPDMTLPVTIMYFVLPLLYPLGKES